MQGVWSYLLHRYTGSDDVVYGVIVSGRPDELPGVEQRVGMYINTFRFIRNLQKRIQRHQTDGCRKFRTNRYHRVQYQYTPLQEIQRWAGISGDLFDSILVFENYPVSEIIGSKQWNLKS